jgi:hypothetical protein
VRRVLWGSAAVLLLAVFVLAYVFRSDEGSPPMLLNPSERLVDEGVAMVMVCGEQPTRETVNMTAAAVVRDRWTGERWTYRHRRGGCVVYYHHLRNGD